MSTPSGYGQDPRQGQQPGYGQHQPGYGEQQPGYGQQGPMGPITTRMSRIDPGPSQGFGVVGALLAGLGAILVAVALTAVDWFTKGTSVHSHASDLKKILDQSGPFAVPVSKAYFSWLGWALLVAAVVVAVLAVLPSPVAKAFRIIGVIVAVLAIAATFLAIRLFSSGAGTGLKYTDYLKHGRLGFYLAVGGFLLIGVGALLGPSRRRT